MDGEIVDRFVPGASTARRSQERLTMKLKHISVLAPVVFLLGYAPSEHDGQLVTAAKLEGPGTVSPPAPVQPAPSVHDPRFVSVAGVRVEVDPRLPFPIARPEQLALVATGKVTIDELIRQGARNWYTATPFSDKPFAVPRELLKTLWLVSMLLEVLVWKRPFVPWLGVSALVVFGIGQVLRLLAIHALGSRWTVKVFTLPNEPRIKAGIFRYLRHPNYTGVILEIAALPLIHGAWLTALLFSIANVLLLSRRIPAEDRALAKTENYQIT
jgi:isoprenylcysteine carboxyl methyltransferase (ICMT) family protein YpbQ